MSSAYDPKDTYVLVTGANSGLGFSICCRLADEFLATRPAPTSLNIIFTTRSTRKAQETARRLTEHLRSASHSPTDISRVHFIPESVDLGSLLSVRSCARRLNATFPKLDAVILNAGIGGWSGIDWPAAIWGVLTDLLQQVTWPTFKVAPVGVATDRQAPEKAGIEEPVLGNVFCANVFGHYMLTHDVAPLLKRANSADGPGRVVWVSSIEASNVKLFDVQDIQGLRSTIPYESSKVLTDLLALTADLPGTAPWSVDSFFKSDSEEEAEGASVTPTMHLVHPGIIATAIVPLPLPLIWAMLGAFLIARWIMGSPWHAISTYVGAISPVFVALASKAELDAAEEPYRSAGGGRPKWGSGTTRFGSPRVFCTETNDWGYGGVVGTPVVEADRKRQRRRGAIDLTAETKENYEDLGRQCWKQMEELRIKWNGILDEIEKAQTN